MNYYPICIPTLCRYEHFKRCVESLKRCSHASETELVIGIDKPTKESHKEGNRLILEYVKGLSGFKKVTVFKHEENRGARGNWVIIQNYALEKYGAAILSEDDNEFAPCFLDFMDKSLDYYWDNASVMTISAYSPIGFEREKCPLCFTQSMCAWGIGRWKHKSYNEDKTIGFYAPYLLSIGKCLSLFFSLPNILSLLVEMVKSGNYYGDIAKSIQNHENHWYQLRPTHSLVINLGQDGTGEHSMANGELYNLQKKRVLPEDLFFNVDFEKVNVGSSLFVKRYQFWRYGDMGRFHVLPQVRVFAGYLKYWVENCSNRNKNEIPNIIEREYN